MVAHDASERLDPKVDSSDASESLLSLDQIMGRILHKQSFDVATKIYTPERLIEETTQLSTQAVHKKRTREADSIRALVRETQTEVVEFVAGKSGHSAKRIRNLRASFERILLALTGEGKRASDLPITSSELEDETCLPPEFLELHQFCISCVEVCEKIAHLKEVHTAGDLFPGWQAGQFPHTASSALDCIDGKTHALFLTRFGDAIHCPQQFKDRAPDIVRAMLSQYGILEQEVRDIVAAYSPSESRRQLSHNG